VTFAPAGLPKKLLPPFGYSQIPKCYMQDFELCSLGFKTSIRLVPWVVASASHQPDKRQCLYLGAHIFLLFKEGENSVFFFSRHGKSLMALKIQEYQRSDRQYCGAA